MKNSSSDVDRVREATVEVENIDRKIAELLARQKTIESDAANQMPSGSFYKYTPKARRKLDTISREITHLMGEKRALLGNPVPCDGYSGRQTNRR